MSRRSEEKASPLCDRAWLSWPLLACLGLTAASVLLAPWIAVTPSSSVSQMSPARFILQYHVICCSCCLECCCSSECLLTCQISSQMTLSETPSLPLSQFLQTRLGPLIFFFHLYFFLQIHITVCIFVYLIKVCFLGLGVISEDRVYMYFAYHYIPSTWLIAWYMRGTYCLSNEWHWISPISTTPVILE